MPIICHEGVACFFGVGGDVLAPAVCHGWYKPCPFQGYTLGSFLHGRVKGQKTLIICWVWLRSTTGLVPCLSVFVRSTGIAAAFASQWATTLHSGQEEEKEWTFFFSHLTPVFKGCYMGLVYQTQDFSKENTNIDWRVLLLNANTAFSFIGVSCKKHYF